MLHAPNAIGILVCGSGMGMSIVANRYRHVRAALCRTVEEVQLSKEHNNANVLVLGARNNTFKEVENMIDTFLNNACIEERHQLRVAKINNVTSDKDHEVEAIIAKESNRQQYSLELIASENIVSPEVLEAQGSVLTNKYAEGYSGRRYYGGCHYVDEVEDLAIKRLKELYNVQYANVQPHSGSQANQAVFLALLQPGDAILGMSLDSGGHLTHGSKVTLSGKYYQANHYHVDPSTGLIDYDAVRSIAQTCRPKLIIAGGSAYPRIVDFAKFRAIADEVGAYLLVDMAHFAGLVAAGVYPTPVDAAHVITSTTHKTLRGPRGGIILTNHEDIAKKINSAVFPGVQGGPLMHVIAAKAVAFGEALRPSFKMYGQQVVRNAQALSAQLVNRGYAVFTGGTDSHLLLLDLRPKGLKGLHAEHALESAGLSCNKNSIPFDTEKPAITSGVRFGSAACTTRGLKEIEMQMVADLIADVLDALQADGTINPSVIASTNRKVEALCEAFPVAICHDLW